jgi:DNA-binding transcriptional MerR regulator
MRGGRDQPEEQLLTPRQAARYLNVALRTLQSWQQRRIGPPSIKLLSGVRRYRKADLDQWIAEHREGG